LATSLAPMFQAMYRPMAAVQRIIVSSISPYPLAIMVER
jgi:hypothetical protein